MLPSLQNLATGMRGAAAAQQAAVEGRDESEGELAKKQDLAECKEAAQKLNEALRTAVQKFQSNPLVQANRSNYQTLNEQYSDLLRQLNAMRYRLEELQILYGREEGEVASLAQQNEEKAQECENLARELQRMQQTVNREARDDALAAYNTDQNNLRTAFLSDRSGVTRSFGRIVGPLLTLGDATLARRNVTDSDAVTLSFDLMERLFSSSWRIRYPGTASRLALANSQLYEQQRTQVQEFAINISSELPLWPGLVVKSMGEFTGEDLAILLTVAKQTIQYFQSKQFRYIKDLQSGYFDETTLKGAIHQYCALKVGDIVKLRSGEIDSLPVWLSLDDPSSFTMLTKASAELQGDDDVLGDFRRMRPTDFMFDSDPLYYESYALKPHAIKFDVELINILLSFEAQSLRRSAVERSRELADQAIDDVEEADVEPLTSFFVDISGREFFTERGGDYDAAELGTLFAPKADDELVALMLKDFLETSKGARRLREAPE